MAKEKEQFSFDESDAKSEEDLKFSFELDKVFEDVDKKQENDRIQGRIDELENEIQLLEESREKALNKIRSGEYVGLGYRDKNEAAVNMVDPLVDNINRNEEELCKLKKKLISDFKF